MAEGKTNQELFLEKQLKILLVKERIAKQAAQEIRTSTMKFSLHREDLVKGIILREILGPSKANEG